MNQIKNTEWKQLCELLNGYIRTQILNTACELELFDILESLPNQTIQELADKLDISKHGLRILLMGLCEAQLIEKTNIGYKNTALASKAFVSTSETSINNFVHLNRLLQMPGCLKFTEALKHKKNTGLDAFPGDGSTLYKRIKGNQIFESIFQKGMGEYTRVSPKMTFLDDFKHIERLLDVGGGDGTNAIRLCQKFPHLHVTILELPSVAKIAIKNIEKAQLKKRIKVLESDIFEDEWPKDYNAVLFSHLLEIFNDNKIISLYQKAAKSMEVDTGKIIIWTMMSNPEENGGLQAVKSSLYFYAVASGEGMAYPADDHKKWLQQTGFNTIDISYISDIDHGLIVASR